MKPVIVFIIIGVAIVIVAAGILTRDLPTERMISDIDKPNQKMIEETEQDIVIHESVTLSSNEDVCIGDCPSSVPEILEIQTTQENDCDESYPDVCIASYPPDLNCGDIGYSNFRVIGSDPHGLDKDNDGIGCETGSPSDPVEPTKEINCDPSYPDVCIASYPPDLNCGDIGYSNFRVIGSDPHGFDRDNDGIGCES